MLGQEAQLGPESGAVGQLLGAASGTPTKVAATWSRPCPLWCGWERHPHPGSRAGLAGVSAVCPCVWHGRCVWWSRVLGAVCPSVCHVHTRPQASLFLVWVVAGPGRCGQQSRAGRACARGPACLPVSVVVTVLHVKTCAFPVLPVWRLRGPQAVVFVPAACSSVIACAAGPGTVLWPPLPRPALHRPPGSVCSGRCTQTRRAGGGPWRRPSCGQSCVCKAVRVRGACVARASVCVGVRHVAGTWGSRCP